MARSGNKSFHFAPDKWVIRLAVNPPILLLVPVRSCVSCPSFQKDKSQQEVIIQSHTTVGPISGFPVQEQPPTITYSVYIHFHIYTYTSTYIPSHLYLDTEFASNTLIEVGIVNGMGEEVFNTLVTHDRPWSAIYAESNEHTRTWMDRQRRKFKWSDKWEFPHGSPVVTAREGADTMRQWGTDQPDARIIGYSRGTETRRFSMAFRVRTEDMSPRSEATQATDRSQCGRGSYQGAGGAAKTTSSR